MYMINIVDLLKLETEQLDGFGLNSLSSHRDVIVIVRIIWTVSCICEYTQLAAGVYIAWNWFKSLKFKKKTLSLGNII